MLFPWLLSEGIFAASFTNAFFVPSKKYEENFLTGKWASYLVFRLKAKFLRKIFKVAKRLATLKNITKKNKKEVMPIEG